MPNCRENDKEGRGRCRRLLSALSYEERARLLDRLAKILTRAATVTKKIANTDQLSLLGLCIRHARLGGVPQHS